MSASTDASIAVTQPSTPRDAETTATTATTTPATITTTTTKESIIAAASSLDALSSIPDTEEGRQQLDQQLSHDLLVACGLTDEKGPEWISLGNKDGCDMFSVKNSSKLLAFRGVATVDCPLSILAVQFMDEQVLRVIDGMCTSVEELRSARLLGGHRQILRSTFQMPPLVSNRDFTYYQVQSYEENKRYIGVAKSISHDNFPHMSGFVRGEITASGYVVDAIDEHSCRVHYYAQADPRGWLPTWAVNIVGKQQAYNPGLIKQKADYFKQLHEKGITVGSDPAFQR